LPKLANQGLGTVANPAGAGDGSGNAQFDDNSPVPEKGQESKTFDYNYRPNYSKNKNKSAEQCELDENVKAEKKEIVNRIKEDSGLVRAAKEACKNVEVQEGINDLEEKLIQGHENPGIGRKHICKSVIEHPSKNGGRLYVREADGLIEILAKSGKKKSNQKFVINRLKEIYG